MDFVPPSASFCLGWREIGRTGWAAGQDGGTSQIKVNPTQVRQEMCHPVVLQIKIFSFYPQSGFWGTRWFSTSGVHFLISTVPHPQNQAWQWEGRRRWLRLQHRRHWRRVAHAAVEETDGKRQTVLHLLLFSFSAYFELSQLSHMPLWMNKDPNFWDWSSWGSIQLNHNSNRIFSRVFSTTGCPTLI